MRRSLVAAVMAVLAAVMMLAGCTPRNNLGTASSECIKAIPAATNDVHHKGKPEGVRVVMASRLASRLPRVAPLGTQRVCLVAFSGDFQPGDVTSAAVQRAGHFAVVVVDTKGKVLDAYVLDRLPLRFRHPI